MAVNPLHNLRPDQAQWARMNTGLASPLWLPFMVAASAGVAWFTYANWARMTAASWGGALKPGQPSGDEAAPAPAPVQPALAAAAPAPVAQPANDVAPAASAEPAAPEPVANDDDDDDDDGADAIDAAYAANLGPVPPPEDAPAGRSRPRSTAKAASKAPAKAAPARSSPAKTPSAKTSPAKAPAAKAAKSKAAPARAASGKSTSTRAAGAKPKGGGKKKGR